MPDMPTKLPPKGRDMQRTAGDWAPRFLAALAQSGIISAAAKIAGLEGHTVYARRDGDDEFAEAMKEAIEEASDLQELEAMRRGIQGVDVPIIYKGQPMGVWVDADSNMVAPGTPGAVLRPFTVKEYSDTLLLALLKANRAKFRESIKHEHGSDPNAPVIVKQIGGEAKMADL